MEKIKECRICSNKKLVKFLDMGCQPPANSLVKDKSIFVEKYPLSLSWCPTCNLVQLNETIEPEKLFSNYVWVTGTSPTTIEYSKKFYECVTSKIKDIDKSYILEIASNDGTFLKPFYKNGYTVLGVDPAENIVKMANTDGITTRCSFFDETSADYILLGNGKAKVIIARNVIPHVANLHGVIKGIVTCLDDIGLLIIECHNASSINQNLHYDSIYHEHLHYFTLKSIEYLLNSYGLYVNDIKESPISGGSMVLFINKRKQELPIVQEYRNKERHINTLESWEDFAIRSSNHRADLLNILPDTPIYGYGASARGLTLLNFCHIDNSRILAIADQNPIKQNMFTPISHIPIVTPKKLMSYKPKCILIIAWNFADEIMDDLKTNYNYEGRFIIPLPEERLIRVIRKKCDDVCPDWEFKPSYCNEECYKFHSEK